MKLQDSYLLTKEINLVEALHTLVTDNILNAELDPHPVYRDNFVFYYAMTKEKEYNQALVEFKVTEHKLAYSIDVTLFDETFEFWELDENIKKKVTLETFNNTDIQKAEEFFTENEIEFYKDGTEY